MSVDVSLLATYALTRTQISAGTSSTILPDRSYILDRIKIDQATGCWVWQGTLNRKGYGRAYPPGSRGRHVKAHRLSYEIFVGPIPDDLPLDHVHERGCRFRGCVNHAHLEPVTTRENNLRRVSARSQATHCKRDHEMTPDNTVAKANGTRQCRRCKRDADRVRRTEISAGTRRLAEGDSSQRNQATPLPRSPRLGRRGATNRQT